MHSRVSISIHGGLSDQPQGHRTSHEASIYKTQLQFSSCREGNQPSWPAFVSGPPVAPVLHPLSVFRWRVGTWRYVYLRPRLEEEALSLGLWSRPVLLCLARPVRRNTLDFSRAAVAALTLGEYQAKKPCPCTRLLLRKIYIPVGLEFTNVRTHACVPRIDARSWINYPRRKTTRREHAFSRFAIVGESLLLTAPSIYGLMPLPFKVADWLDQRIESCAFCFSCVLMAMLSFLDLMQSWRA